MEPEGSESFLGLASGAVKHDSLPIGLIGYKVLLRFPAKMWEEGKYNISAEFKHYGRTKDQWKEMPAEKKLFTKTGNAIILNVMDGIFKTWKRRNEVPVPVRIELIDLVMIVTRCSHSNVVVVIQVQVVCSDGTWAKYVSKSGSSCDGSMYLCSMQWISLELSRCNCT